MIKIITKIVSVFIVWITYIFVRLNFVIDINEQAINQLNDTANSYTNLETHQLLWNISIIIPIIICLILFKNELETLYYKIKN